MSDGNYGTSATTRFLLPLLQPPADGLVALLDAPTTARLHQPVPLRLIIRNRHPTRTANVTVQLEPDAATDAFVVAGLRHGRVPILLPDTEERLVWNLIPVECGLVRVPRVKVVDRRSAVQVPGGQPGAEGVSQASEGEEVRIVDVRWEARKGLEGEEDEPVVRPNKQQDAFVLVVP